VPRWIAVRRIFAGYLAINITISVPAGQPRNSRGCSSDHYLVPVRVEPTRFSRECPWGTSALWRECGSSRNFPFTNVGSSGPRVCVRVCGIETRIIVNARPLNHGVVGIMILECPFQVVAYHKTKTPGFVMAFFHADPSRRTDLRSEGWHSSVKKKKGKREGKEREEKKRWNVARLTSLCHTCHANENRSMISDALRCFEKKGRTNIVHARSSASGRMLNEADHRSSLTRYASFLRILNEHETFIKKSVTRRHRLILSLLLASCYRDR